MSNYFNLPDTVGAAAKTVLFSANTLSFDQTLLYDINKYLIKQCKRRMYMYLLAVLLPPVAVLICGKPIQALINLLLCLIFYIPGMIHAIMVVNEYKADQRAARQ